MGYTVLGLYNDAGDRRLVVPKRRPWLGWTINLGHPAGGPVLLALGMAIGLATAAALAAT